MGEGVASAMTEGMAEVETEATRGAGRSREFANPFNSDSPPP